MYEPVVLSLFDGISCGQEALKRAGIKPKLYLSSEIEKYPMFITRKNFPETVQLGDVQQVFAKNLPKIDLILAGSPCQGFSFAGSQLAFDHPQSKLFFEFTRILEECKAYNPNVKFLLENVKMKKEFEQIITDHVGVEPVHINSSLVSAQNRQRLYWANFPITIPKDKGILLKDILENGVGDIVTNQGKTQHKANVDKASTLLARDYKGFGNQGMTGVRLSQPNEILYEEPYVKLNGNKTGCVGYVGNSPKQATRIYSVDGKSQCLSANGGGQGGKTGLYQIPSEPKVTIIPQQVRVRKHEVDVELLQHCLLSALKNSGKTKQQIADELKVKFSTVEHYFRKVGSKSFSIPSEEHWFDLKAILNIETDEFDASITEFEIRDGRYDMADRVYNPEYKAPTVIASGVAKVLCVNPKKEDGTQTYQQDRVYSAEGKMAALSATLGGRFNVEENNNPTYRRLTVKECSRLQTFYDDYLENCYDDKGKPISNSQKYKALGNGWTIDVIAHIFKGLNSF